MITYHKAEDEDKFLAKLIEFRRWKEFWDEHYFITYVFDSSLNFSVSLLIFFIVVYSILRLKIYQENK